MITKAIIPVAGWGTRRLPITKVLEKSMLPVGNRPLVDYSVQELIAAGVKDIYMVISNVEPCQVREFYRDNWALNQYLRELLDKKRASLAGDECEIRAILLRFAASRGFEPAVVFAVMETETPEDLW